MKKKFFFICTISLMCIGCIACGFFEIDGGDLFYFKYVVAVSAVDSEKTETLNLSRPAGENNEDPYIKNNSVETDYYISVNYMGYPSDSSSITDSDDMYFTLSYSAESTGNEVYLLVLPERIGYKDSFPSELFPDGDVYSYLEDENKIHDVLQTLYENNYWGIKKLTPADGSITITFKEAYGD